MEKLQEQILIQSEDTILLDMEVWVNTVFFNFLPAQISFVQLAVQLKPPLVCFFQVPKVFVQSWHFNL